ncbi:MAG: hypothetical protein QOE45_1060 [Frankiaceae bacterium]|jgi:hypothetical protein|nr:hypothetical protein [Frankiaceae bacterium]
MRRALAVAAGTLALVVGTGGPALACGGLIGPNGAVNLTRTTTFAGYHAGVEHYVTSFSFQGGGGRFGSLTPLPGVPTKVERGGDWTLQRLVRETEVRLSAGVSLASAETAKDAQVLLQVRVDALDITVLKGGGAEVGRWATQHGFRLPPDAPQVLDFYADRSPIFLAAAFDADAAKERGQQVGDGTPVHITIPTANPWVPLRILGLGKQGAEPVNADVYLLTDERPTLLSTGPIGTGFDGPTLSVVHDARATKSLLKDLHDDKTGSWVPATGWLTKVRIAGPAGTLTGDLAIDAKGVRRPSTVAAGFSRPAEVRAANLRVGNGSTAPAVATGLVAGCLLAAGALTLLRRRAG